MTGPHPSVAEVRCAVRACLAELPPGPVAVAYSGGADSTALLAATCFESDVDVVAYVVDQHWYDGSRAAADAAATQARDLGAEVTILDAPSTRDEAAARTARYAELDVVASARGCVAVLLGHTRDDQAETVLLGLARGSGARSLAGMPAARGIYRRPLLAVSRATTRDACRAEGLVVYDDPANEDPRFLRTRVRVDALPALAAALDRDVVANLARSADLLRDDADLLDELAATAAVEVTGADGSLDATAVGALPPALRRRVLRGWADGANAAQVGALDALVTRWRGQGPVALAGGAQAVRTSGRIVRVPGPDVGRDDRGTAG